MGYVATSLRASATRPRAPPDALDAGAPRDQGVTNIVRVKSRQRVAPSRKRRRLRATQNAGIQERARKLRQRSIASIGNSAPAMT
jgi:hypothetical protein